MEPLELESRVLAVLKDVYDPEIPVNIYDLGLIYEVTIDDAGKASIVMTLTSPNCPVAESLPQEVRDRVMAVPGIRDVDLELTFEPPWNRDMMSETAMLELGFL
jgi:FeS assembly SUF system protein